MKNNTGIWLNSFLFMLIISLIVLPGCGTDGDAGKAESFYEAGDGQAPSYESSMAERTDEIYQDAMERLMDTENVEQMEGKDIFDKLAGKLLRGSRKAYRMVRALSPAICICSIGCGILMMVLSTHNKRVKRMGLYAFIIAVPCIVLLFVFGIGIFNGIFLY